MTDFHALDPQTRSVALVGTFLQRWSWLESAINRAIAKSLDLSTLQSAVATSNIQLRDKIHILRTIVNMSISDLLGAKTKADKTLRKIGKLASTRNMMAHNGFAASDDGMGVKFYVTNAKGTFEIPDIVWSIEKFETECAHILRLTDGVNEIAGLLKTSPLLKKLGEKSPQPMTIPMPSGFLGLLNLPFLANQTSDTNLSNAKTDVQTLVGPPEKSPED